ncbi:MAG: choice-of-anchor tandem repeat GloVer-containing protein [Candidatus Sulfotelmatobacter sp.]
MVVLHDFTGGDDGFQPEAGVIFHNGMSLYGTTFWGGTEKSGTVFELSPPAAGKTGWTKTTIFNFDAYTTGQSPLGLVSDKAGNIYGAARFSVDGNGEVFELSPPAALGSPWTETTLYSWTCDCGPASLIFDKGNALYGLGAGGTNNEGQAFAIFP